MRKVLFCVICLFTFLNIVYADEDHSLNYDIEFFELTENEIIISGWAFIHNYDNYGGMPDGNYNYNYTNTWGTKQSISLDKSDDHLSVYFFFEVGGNKLIGKDNKSLVYVNFIDSDLTNVMCYKATQFNNNCNDDDGSPNVYKNVRFKVVIPLDDFMSNMGSLNWNLKIGAQLGSRPPIEENLAIDKNIVSLFSEDNFKISGLGDKINVTGNHVTHSASDISYWKLTKNYFFDSSKRECPENSVCSYYLYYKKGDNTSDSSYIDACGFNATEKMDSGGAASRICTAVCNPNNESCSSSKILTTFIKPSGSVTIKYIGNNDKYCKKTVLDKDKVLNNCDSSVSYLCGEMTVKSGGKSANISISENVSIDSTDTFLKTITAGKGFEYNITYTDTVSWKKVSGNLTDDEINQIFNDTYYIYNKNEMVTKLNSAIKDGLNMNISDKYKEPNFSEAGSWNCNDVVISGNTYTAKCTYTIKNAAINRKTGLITGYMDAVDSNSLDGGNRYYIPLKYSDKIFKWKIQFGDIKNSLSLLKVHYEKDKPLISPTIYIDTGDFEEGNVLSSNMCYINVKNDFYNVEDNGSSKEIKGLKFVYRSISINNPFPSNRSKPQNWVKYEEEHGLVRLDNSFNNLVYVTEKDIRTTLSGEYDYWDKGDVDNEGHVDIVEEDGKNFEHIYGTLKDRHCKLGEFLDGVCDSK